MLILTRKSDESVIIDNKIEIKVISIKGDQVRLGFSAPRAVSIHRKEVFEAIEAQNRLAASSSGDSIHHIKQSLQRDTGDQLCQQINERGDA